MIDSPARPVLRSGTALATLDPAAGGRLAGLSVDGVQLLKTSGAGVVAWGCYPMAPWAGRLRDGVLAWRGATHQLPIHLGAPHAMHGTVIETAWEIIAADERSATLAAPLGRVWPFAGRGVQDFRLEPVALRATITVEAADAEFPAVVGWHPWFLRHLRAPDGTPFGGPAEILLPAGGMLRRGPDYLPNGEVVRPIPPGPWDDCFVDLVGVPGVRWPGAMEVALESDVAYWVCYTQPPEAVCLEPQTGPPNGLNTGECAVVGPGRPLTASMTLRWSLLA